MMTAAYMRRQEWIAERTAVNTMNLLGQLLTGKKGKKGGKRGGDGKVSASGLLAMAGEEIGKHEHNQK